MSDGSIELMLEYHTGSNTNYSCIVV